MSEPPWAARNIIFKDYDIENKSIIDFGCGDKSICNYLNFSNYVGYDLNPKADYNIDFNSNFTITHTADIGLVLGVLEYLDDPNAFIEKIKSTCDRFIIMTLAIKAPKYHHGWKRCYNDETFNEILTTHFNNINRTTVNRYLIADVTP